jgi:trans-2-enoyl-CoA reductase
VLPPVTACFRISAAFGSGAATIGVFFEKPGTETKPGSAGWYNSAAFDEAANAKVCIPKASTATRSPMNAATQSSN